MLLVPKGDYMSLLPPFYLDTVVAIGVGDDPSTRKWIGT
jgi:hypothetical protein